MINGPGNFVCAAMMSFYNHSRLGIDEDGWFTNEQVNNLLKDKCNRFLVSLGSELDRKIMIIRERMINSFVEKKLKRFHNSGFFKDCEIIIDSGGYQIQKGMLHRNDIPKFIDLYYDNFVKNNTDLFSYAFNLDLAPGAVHCPFSSFDDMKALNLYSFGKSANFDKELKSKMIYIHHFRTPKIHEIYNELLFKHDLGDGFTCFSTGGLVSFTKIGEQPPYLLYVIPLLELIKYNKAKGINKFRFHILGASQWKEILGHKLLEIFIQKLLGVEVEITFDSSTCFQAFCMAREAYFKENSDNNSLKLKNLKLQISSLDKFINESDSSGMDILTNKQAFCRTVNENIEKYGMRTLNENEEIYNERHTFSNSIYAYGIFHMLDIFNSVEKYCSFMANEIYLNFNDKEKVFDLIRESMMSMTPYKRFSIERINLLATSIMNTVNLIEEFKTNEDKTIEKTNFIIKKYMSGDECQQLMNSGIKTFEKTDLKKKSEKRIYKSAEKMKNNITYFE